MMQLAAPCAEFVWMEWGYYCARCGHHVQQHATRCPHSYPVACVECAAVLRAELRKQNKQNEAYRLTEAYRRWKASL